MNRIFARVNNFVLSKNYLFLCALKIEGSVAEWLGRALQKLPQRFESARDLKIQSCFRSKTSVTFETAFLLKAQRLYFCYNLTYWPSFHHFNTSVDKRSQFIPF